MDRPAAPWVDVDTVLAFWQLLRERGADGPALDALQVELAAKSRRIQALLDGSSPDDASLLELLGSVRAGRRRVGALLGQAGAGRWRAALGALTGPGPGDERLAAFVGQLAPTGQGAAAAERTEIIALGAELLRHREPQSAWSWTRWLYESGPDTGALRLLCSESGILRGRDIADTYRRIGRVMGQLRTLAGRGGLWPGIAGPYGPEVFGAAVYAVYTHTVLSLQMTREFTKVVPPLLELSRRLLL